MSVAMKAADWRPKVLFVDDEQRVLNSMRIMFRREYDLFLAPNGPTALEIIKTEDIDVIVADHRMPQMTGVEVLSQVRALSPRTVRILLTGYADLDAVEGSINESEVFRFLTKPCAPDELRETISQAAAIAVHSDTAASAGDSAPAVNREHGPGSESASESARVVASKSKSPAPSRTTPETARRSRTTPAGNSAAVSASPLRGRTAPATEPAPVSRKRLAQGVGVIVFSSDEEVVLAVQQAVRGRLPVYPATNVIKVIKILIEHKPGVLLTDIAADKATIQSMTAQLKEHLPELVTIAVSPHRDIFDMVWLINHGQIFRFMRKPLSAGRCAVCLQAALKHHRTLLKNPNLVQRHQVVDSPPDESGVMQGLMSRLKSVRRLWGSA